VRVCGSRVLMGILGPEQMMMAGGREGGGTKLPSEKIQDCTVHQLLLG